MRSTFETLAAKDWVKASQEGLKPVEAGRFIVHSEHDRASVRVEPHRHRDRDRVRLRHRPPRHHAGMPAGARPSSQGATSAARAGRRHRNRRAGDRGGPGAAPPGAGKRHRSAARRAWRARTSRRNRAPSVTVVHAAGLGDAAVSRSRRRSTSCSPTSCSRRCSGMATPMARLLAPGARVVLSGLLTVAGQRRARGLSPARPRARTARRARRLVDAGIAARPQLELDCAAMFEAKFQTFDDAANRGGKRAAGQGAAHRAGAARAYRLRGAACRLPPERIPAARRRSGSPGSPASPARPARAIVLMERAALFVDGRYTLQAREQVDTSLFEIVHLVETPPDQWIERTLSKGDALGFDPWLHTVEGAEKLARACANAGATLVPIEPNPIDELWKDRPAPPLGAVTLHDMRFAGEAAETKLSTDPARDRQAEGRRAGRVRSARGRLDLQHPRRRRLAHAAAALVRRSSRARAARRCSSTAASSSNDVRHRLEELADVRAPGDFAARRSPRSARPARRCASTRRPPPTRWRGS